MRIIGLHCTDCQHDDVIAIWPGKEVAQCDIFRPLPNRPVKAWCELCWIKRFGPKPRLPRRGSNLKSRPVAQI